MISSTIKSYADAAGECLQSAETPTAAHRAIRRSEVVYALSVLVIGILFFATAV